MGGSGSHCGDVDIVLTEEEKIVRELSKNSAYTAAKEAIMLGIKGANAHVDYVIRCENSCRERFRREALNANEWVHL